MENGLITLIGSLVLYAPVVLITLVVGFAVFTRVAPLLDAKEH